MIDVINLEKHFGDNEVLRGINVTIDKGDIMVVIGLQVLVKVHFFAV